MSYILKNRSQVMVAVEREKSDAFFLQAGSEQKVKDLPKNVEALKKQGVVVKRVSN